MHRQSQTSPSLPTKVSQRLSPEPTVRFGEGFIAPRIAMHHAKEMKLPQTISMPARRADAEPTVRFGEGFIAPKIAMHHRREIK